jgi:hypothetical protein
MVSVLSKENVVALVRTTGTADWQWYLSRRVVVRKLLFL